MMEASGLSADKKRILVVDDEPDLCEIMSFNLMAAGYEVKTALSADEALECLHLAERKPFDLVILDVMMPGMSGFELAERIHAMPIIFLTALGSEDDMLQGFHLGADDYITKPFSVREVLARVKAVLNRTRNQQPKPTSLTPQPATADPLSIDLAAKTVSIDGRLVPFTPTEFYLLKTLIDAPGRVFSREELIQLVWPADVVVTTRTVDVNMTRIRKKLGAYAQRIVSRQGFGYCYEASPTPS